MRKYIEVAKALFKTQIVYRFDVMITSLEVAGRVLFAWLLWGAVYTSRDTVGGFTFQAMLSYYVMSAFIRSLDLSGGVSGEVSARIRGGTFSKYMVVPTNPQIHFWAQTMGTAAYYALFSLPVAVLCAWIFRAGALPMTWTAVLYGVAIIPLGLAFMVCYQFFIGILTFKFQDIGFFLYVQMSLIQFAMGGLVPLNLLPDSIENVFRFLPFAHVVYTPAMLLIGSMNAGEGLLGLVVLTVWTVFMALVGHLTYHRLRNKYDGVGI